MIPLSNSRTRTEALRSSEIVQGPATSQGEGRLHYQVSPLQGPGSYAPGLHQTSRTHDGSCLQDGSGRHMCCDKCVTTTQRKQSRNNKAHPYSHHTSMRACHSQRCFPEVICEHTRFHTVLTRDDVLCLHQYVFSRT